MYGHRQRLDYKVGQTLLASEVQEGELALANAVAQPVEARVDTLGSLLLYGVAAQPDSKFIVAEDWGRGLWVAHGDGYGSNPDTLLCFDGCGAVLSFTGGCYNDVDDSYNDVDDRADGMSHAVFNGGVVGIAVVYNDARD
jgi:hypothetical protein